MGVIFFHLNYSFAQSMQEQNLFLGETPPGNTPKVFPLAVRSGFFAAERIAISDDGRDIYYTEIKGYYPIRGEKIKRYTFIEGKWQGPFDLFDGYAPELSPSGDAMYFERKEIEIESHTYMAIKNGSGWGNPEWIFTRLDSAHYFQVTNSGNFFISTKSGNGAGLSDWCRVNISGKDTSATSLGKPLNTSGEDLDFFISRDESFMIVTNRPALGISFRIADGSWTNPRMFDKQINFGLASWGPWVTPDNKYLFYTTGTKPDYSDVAVYWVRIDGIIGKLKKSSVEPVDN